MVPNNPFEDPRFDIDSPESIPLVGGSSDDNGKSQVEFPVDDFPDNSVTDTDQPDARISFKYAAGWSAHIKRDWMKEYCYSQSPGEDFYHVLVGGEVYVQRGTEKFCLTCAIRLGHVTRDRMHWQRGGARPSE